MGTSPWYLKIYLRTIVFIMKEKMRARNKYKFHLPPEIEHEHVSGVLPELNIDNTNSALPVASPL